MLFAMDAPRTPRGSISGFPKVRQRPGGVQPIRFRTAAVFR
jgi:hypothetical protein